MLSYLKILRSYCFLYSRPRIDTLRTVILLDEDHDETIGVRMTNYRFSNLNETSTAQLFYSNALNVKNGKYDSNEREFVSSMKGRELLHNNYKVIIGSSSVFYSE